MTLPVAGATPSSAVPERARELAAGLVEAGGGQVRAILLYGSHLHGSSPGEHSAWDFVLLVNRYAPFHRALKAAGHCRRPGPLMDLMGKALPPYVTAIEPIPGRGLTKCLVASWDQLQEALGPKSKDHFLKGRMVQHVEVVWADSPEMNSSVEQLLADARHAVLDWAGPFVREPFDARTLTQTMLEVSFEAELRPESGGRVLEVWRSQSDWLEPAYEKMLEAAADKGEVVRAADGGYHFTSPRRADRGIVRAYFRRSKIRGTLRWGKHMFTFNDWLTYIQRKTERRTGLTIELTPLERKWPLIFLWPKVFMVLRHRKATHATNGGANGRRPM